MDRVEYDELASILEQWLEVFLVGGAHVQNSAATRKQGAQSTRVAVAWYRESVSILARLLDRHEPRHLADAPLWPLGSIQAPVEEG